MDRSAPRTHPVLFWFLAVCGVHTDKAKEKKNTRDCFACRSEHIHSHLLVRTQGVLSYFACRREQSTSIQRRWRSKNLIITLNASLDSGTSAL